jgi:hypothetical protein
VRCIVVVGLAGSEGAGCRKECSMARAVVSDGRKDCGELSRRDRCDAMKGRMTGSVVSEQQSTTVQ